MIRRKRTLVIAGIIVALSLGIVIASVPLLPHPPGTLQRSETHTIPAGSSSSPSSDHITLSGIPAGVEFRVGVTVTNGTATFCVLQTNNYVNWSLSNQLSGGNTPFPYSDCIFQKQTTQDTLSFTPPTTGSWDVAVLNMNPNSISVQFSPA
jgi:hypothetical protein